MRHPIPGQLLDRLIGDGVTGEFIDEFVEAVGFGLDGMGLGDGVAEDVQESELHYFFLSFPRARKETHNQLCKFNVGPACQLNPLYFKYDHHSSLFRPLAYVIDLFMNF